MSGFEDQIPVAIGEEETDAVVSVCTLCVRPISDVKPRLDSESIGVITSSDTTSTLLDPHVCSI